MLVHHVTDTLLNMPVSWTKIIQVFFLISEKDRIRSLLKNTFFLVL